MALQEQSTLVKRFLDVKKTLETGEINTGYLQMSIKASSFVCHVFS